MYYLLKERVGVEMVNLGDEVRDTVSGFRGIAVSRHIYLQGCHRINVQAKVGKDGKLSEAQTFDEPQLEVVKHSVVVTNEYGKEDQKPGGPMPYVPKDKKVAKR